MKHFPKIGIVGAGRSQQGLGPYLANFLERSGARVAGVSGRDRQRTELAAGALAEALGHDVAVAGDAEALAQQVDALVVACPVAGHLAGLDAALRAGVPCLCEKPLVAAEQLAAGLERVRQFRDRGLLLAENCQWPFVLPPLAAPRGRPFAGVRRVAMGLSPAGAGRAMLEDSLSHVLSLAQAVADFGGGAEVVDVVENDPGPRAERNTVRFRIADGDVDVAVELALERCPHSPRPAWLALDDVRYDREIGPGYGISFHSGDAPALAVGDPLAALVEHFVAGLRAPDRDAARALADAIELRARLYAAVLAALA